MLDKLIKYRRDIHSNPELSFKEYETSAYICNILAKLNIPYKIINNTGVIATLGNVVCDNCIAFRCELDALPMTEKVGVPFASKNVGVMHSCGHDLHIAMLLAAAEIFHNKLDLSNACIKLIFQAGEEVLPGGAKSMIEAGVLNNPRPKYIFAQHIDPDLPIGTIGIPQKEAMAATCEFKITINGKATHGSTPHKGSEPIAVAANIINFTQSFINRYNNPFNPAVLSICAINGGTVNNAFPDTVQMLGTLRTYNKSDRSRYLQMYEAKCKQIAAAYDTECEINIVYGYPPVINNSEATAIVMQATDNIAVTAVSIEPKMWAEDFAYFADEIPACFYFLGIKTDNQPIYPLHSPNINPNEDAMQYGLEVIVAIAENVFNKK